MRTIESLDLSSYRTLVCGGSQGIGKGCALALGEAGASVTVLARDERALRAAVDELTTHGGRSHAYLVADFADPASVARVVETFVKETGPVQVLLNNTGGPPSGSLSDSSADQLRLAFQAHVQTAQLLVRALVEGMKQSHFGRIINIISTSVLQPIRGLGVSNTIRGAMANWGRTLAGELAPFGITVNNILPGYVATERLRSLLTERAQRLGVSYEQVEQTIVAAIPAGRLGTPGDIGRVVAFLASPAAEYVNGVNLPVDGGRTAIQ